MCHKKKKKIKRRQWDREWRIPKKKKNWSYLMWGENPITSGLEKVPKRHNYLTLLPCDEECQSRVWPFQQGGQKCVNLHQMCTYNIPLVALQCSQAGAIATCTNTVHVKLQPFGLLQTGYCQLAAHWKLQVRLGGMVCLSNWLVIYIQRRLLVSICKHLQSWREDI